MFGLGPSYILEQPAIVKVVISRNLEAIASYVKEDAAATALHLNWVDKSQIMCDANYVI